MRNMLTVPRKPSTGGGLPVVQEENGYTAGKGASARLSDSAAGPIAQVGEIQARRLEGLGKAFFTIGAGADRLYKDLSETEAYSAYNAMTKAMNERLYGEGGIYTKKGMDAAKTPENVESALDQTLDDVRKEHNLGGLSERLFGTLASRYRSGQDVTARRYAQQEFMSWRSAELEATGKNAAENAVVNWRDEDLFKENVSIGLDAIGKQCAMRGLGPEAEKEARDKFTSKVYSAVGGDALSSGNLGKASEILGSGVLQSADASKLRDAIDVEKRRIEAEAKAAQARAEAHAFASSVQDQTSSVMAKLSGLGEDATPTEKEHFALEYVSDIQDPKVRAHVLQRVSADMRFQETQEKARASYEAEAFEKTFEQNPNTPISDRWSALENTGMSKAGKALCARRLQESSEGDANAANSSANAKRIRDIIDSSNVQLDESQVRAMAVSAGLNKRDTSNVLGYHGIRTECPQYKVNEKLDRMFKDNGLDDDERGRIYSAVAQTVKANNGKWDDNQVGVTIYNMMRDVSTAGKRGTTKLFDVVAQGKAGLARSEMNDDQKFFYSNMLNSQINGFDKLPRKARELLMQKQYMWDTYKINITFTPEEAAILGGEVNIPDIKAFRNGGRI